MIGLKILIPFLLLLLPSSVAARPHSPVLPGPPTQVRIFVSGADGCLPGCAEWISIEGVIDQNTPALFRSALKHACARKPLVAIHSGGGLIEAAMAIGRLIRAKGLDVSVAKSGSDASHTQQSPPGEKPDTPVIASGWTDDDAYCASACTLILAAGKARHVPYDASVGLHEMLVPEQDVTQRMRYYQTRTLTRNGRVVSRETHIVGEKQIRRHVSEHISPKSDYRSVIGYLNELGLPAGKIVELMRSAEPSDMVWLTTAQLEDTKLMTDVVSATQVLKLEPESVAAAPEDATEGAAAYVPPDALTVFAGRLGVTVAQLFVLALLVAVMGFVILRSLIRVRRIGRDPGAHDPPML